MTFTRLASTVSLFVVVAGLAVNAHCQTYYLSTPILPGRGGNGVPPLTIQDGSYSGSIKYTWNTLTETIYLDPVAQTIRQVGFASVSINPAASNIVLNEIRDVPGQFPNPPQTNVPATVTLSAYLVGGGFSFDTGVQPITWNPTAQAYTFNGSLAAFPFLVTGSYFLVTGGQTLTGTFNYSLPVWAWMTFSTFNQLDLDNYPTSLSLGGLNNPDEYVGYNGNGPVFCTTLATNGVQMELYASGLYDATWSMQTPVTASNILSGPPFITAQPQGVLATAHANASFNVSAFGAMPLGYQWSLNGTNIAGATSSTLTIPNVRQYDLGTYAVVVTNSFGSVTSSNAVLSMYPFIAAPFAGAITYWGKDATLSLQAWGTEPLGYQWYKDGVAILNANTQTLSFTSIQATNAGLYSVVVTSPLGSVTNAPAQVIVYPAGVSLGFCPSVTISGVIGYSYIIERTVDLTNTNSWVTLTNLTLALPVQLWVDTNVDATSPFGSKYFYRVLPGQ